LQIRGKGTVSALHQRLTYGRSVSFILNDFIGNFLFSLLKSRRRNTRLIPKNPQNPKKHPEKQDINEIPTNLWDFSGLNLSFPNLDLNNLDLVV